MGVYLNTGKLPKTSMQYRLDVSGIKTIRDNNQVYLEHSGKRILRPNIWNCEIKVKQEFNIDI